MNKKFINYKIDINKGNGPILSITYNVKYLPTIIIVTPDGKIISKKSATMNPEKFLKWVKASNRIFYAGNKNMNLKNKFPRDKKNLFTRKRQWEVSC